MNRIQKTMTSAWFVMAAIFSLTRLINMLSSDQVMIEMTRSMLWWQYFGFAIVFPLVAVRSSKIPIRTMLIASVCLIAYMVVVQLVTTPGGLLLAVCFAYLLVGGTTQIILPEFRSEKPATN